MPQITESEARHGCPYCNTKVKFLRKRWIKDKETGESKFGGTYISCKCTALSWNEKSGYNLANRG